MPRAVRFCRHRKRGLRRARQRLHPLKSQPSQNVHIEFEEFRAALDKLPQDQREALILVGASGFSYEDAAAICGCAVGTIKRRVNRARSKLSNLLYVEGADDFGPDNTIRAVIGGNG